MKRRLEPGQVQAFAARGQPREPEGLRRYRVGRETPGSECFPRGRYCLVVDLACRRSPDVRVVDTRVERFYRGVLPWLLRRTVRGAAAQRWIDLVGLIDELMEREDELYGSAVAWPLAELAAVFQEATAALGDPCRADDGDETQVAGLREEFAGHASALAQHAGCCREGLVNVHWW